MSHRIFLILFGCFVFATIECFPHNGDVPIAEDATVVEKEELIGGEAIDLKDDPIPIPLKIRNNCRHLLNPETDQEFLEQDSFEIINMSECNANVIYATTFAEMGNLKSIDLSDNQIAHIQNGIFDNNPELRELYLNDNQIYQIDSDVFINLHNFTELRMDGNKEFDFPVMNIFVKSDSIKYYSCYQCGITNVYDLTFAFMPNLRELDVEANQILFVDPMALIGNPNIVQIDFSYNQLESFPIDILRYSETLVRVYLDGNPFVPSSENLEMTAMFVARKLRDMNAEDTVKFEYELGYFTTAAAEVASNEEIKTTVWNENESNSELITFKSDSEENESGVENDSREENESREENDSKEENESKEEDKSRESIIATWDENESKIELTTYKSDSEEDESRDEYSDEMLPADYWYLNETYTVILNETNEVDMFAGVSTEVIAGYLLWTFSIMMFVLCVIFLSKHVKSPRNVDSFAYRKM